MGLFVAQLDPFINIWDERFHALVAKNLLVDPLRPVLIPSPLFGVPNYAWNYCEIWLHKQPLFLWQIALSIKLFGLNEMAIRIPSVLMHALLVICIYRVGRLLSNYRVGYYAALFFTCAYFPLEFLTGFYATDHNDNAFLFYSFVSLWSLIEYYQSKKSYFIFLIALTAGGAVLCKWLTGLLVYGVWLLTILFSEKKTNYKNELQKFLSSLVLCLLIFLPWQFFTLINYPIEFQYTMSFNAKHIFEALEGHGGNSFFYYEALYEQFGEGLLIPPFILLCFVFMLTRIKNIKHKYILLVPVVATSIFFTIVKTKMLGYTFLNLPIFILGFAFLFDLIVEKIAKSIPSKFQINKLVIIPLLISVTMLFFNSDKLNKHHSNREYGRFVSRFYYIKEKQLYLNIKNSFGSKKCLLFNCSIFPASEILATFYTDYPSFSYILSNEQIKLAKDLEYNLIAIDNGKLPKHIIDDLKIVKVRL